MSRRDPSQLHQQTLRYPCCRRCGHHFCYICGLPWRTCNCDQWDAERLRARAEAQVRQNLQGAPQGQRPNAQEYQQAVDDMADDLRENHECVHTWARRSPSPQWNCTNCGYFLPLYGYACTSRRCLAVICYTCRFHRLDRLIV
jgi:hypothetical protein